MSGSRFVYVTYIRTTPEKLWRALTEPEFTQKYWAGTRQVSDWKKGARWEMFAPDGRLTDFGKVIEIEPYTRLVLEWTNQFMPDLKSEGASRCNYLLEEDEAGVKLTLTHEMTSPNSKLIEAVSGGWPSILASVKSLLETGAALAGTDNWPEDA